MLPRFTNSIAMLSLSAMLRAYRMIDRMNHMIHMISFSEA